MNRAVSLVLALLLGLGLAATAQAHSTKGRIKVELNKAQPTVDDFAYFMESYVHRHLYKDRYEKYKGRFYLKDFVKLEQQGDRATVHFITLDFKAKTRGEKYKGKSEFPETMIFQRDNQGWFYQPLVGDPVRVYTYVDKWGYYYQRYVLPGAGVGMVLALGSFTILRQRRKKAAAPQAA